MMNRTQQIITQELSSIFIKHFHNSLTKEITKLHSYKINIVDFLPEILLEGYGVQTILSIEKGHIMFNFVEDHIGEMRFHFINGDVINFFDRTGKWSNKAGPVGISIVGSSNINIKNSSFGGLKPFTLEGNIIEMYLENMNFDVPSGEKINLKYAFVFSINRLVNTFQIIEEFTSNLVFTYWDYFNKYKEKLDSTSNKYQDYLTDLKRVKDEMHYYFYEESILEKEIEDFINRNSVIITEVLGLSSPIIQAELKDIENIHGQTLKPDLMGFDTTRDNWTIVDYKLGRKSNLVRTPGGVRTKFYDDVQKLEAQLRIYRKYFNEKKHREYFNKKYQTKINEYPETIGIIGYVNTESRKDFNELLDEKQRWFNLVPYNDLQAKFERLISIVERIN